MHELHYIRFVKMGEQKKMLNKWFEYQKWGRLAIWQRLQKTFSYPIHKLNVRKLVMANDQVVVVAAISNDCGDDDAEKKRTYFCNI